MHLPLPASIFHSLPTPFSLSSYLLGQSVMPLLPTSLLTLVSDDKEVLIVGLLVRCQPALQSQQVINLGQNVV